MKKIDELKEKAKVDLKSAQKELASLCEDYTDRELANLWDISTSTVTQFRNKMGIVKATGREPSVDKIEDLPRNPFGSFNEKIKCGEVGMTFKLQGNYSVEEIIKILRRIDLFDDNNMIIDLTIREGGE